MTVRFSVVVPVHDPPVEVLREACASVFAQREPHWELCLVDDASTDPAVIAALAELASRPDVRLVTRARSGGISAATNDGIDATTGEWIAFLDHDDVLHPDALGAVAEAISALGGDVDLVYTDEDLLDPSGRRHSPFFKPPWSPERFRTQMYVRHLLVARRAAVDAVGGLRSAADGAQDWDLAWRVAELRDAVAHVPRILYHWRQTEGSTAADPDAKRWAFDAGARVLQEHCDRVGVPARVEHDDDLAGVYHLRPDLTDAPLVSVIVPTAGARRVIGPEDVVLVEACARGLMASSYTNWELVLVVDPATPDGVVERVRTVVGERLVELRADGPFDYSARNNEAALVARGEYVLLLNDDVVPRSADWIEHMLVHACTPGVGAVGARLHYDDGRIQHVGTFIAPSGPSHLYHGYPGHHLGYGVTIRVATNLEAVTGACLLTPRARYMEVGGMSPELPLNYNDIDFCQKLRHRGLRIVYCPDAILTHHESASRGPGHAQWELDRFWGRWQRNPLDHYRNPNLISGELPPQDRVVYSAWWEAGST